MTTLITLNTPDGIRLINTDHVVSIDPSPRKITKGTYFRIYVLNDSFDVLDPWSVIKKHFEVIAFYPNEVKS